MVFYMQHWERSIIGHFQLFKGLVMNQCYFFFDKYESVLIYVSILQKSGNFYNIASYFGFYLFISNRILCAKGDTSCTRMCTQSTSKRLQVLIVTNKKKWI